MKTLAVEIKDSDTYGFALIEQLQTILELCGRCEAEITINLKIKEDNENV